MGEARRRFVITAEVLVEVTDAAILRRAALDRVAEAGFVADGDRGLDEVRLRNAMPCALTLRRPWIGLSTLMESSRTQWASRWSAQQCPSGRKAQLVPVLKDCRTSPPCFLSVIAGRTIATTVPAFR
jgi:hypothetical protein